MFFFLIFDFWGRGTGKRWSDFGSPFCCSRYFCLWSFLVHFSVCTLLISIDPWSLLQTRALHQSYELRSFPSMPCNSLPSVRDPSPSACSSRRRLPDRTAKSHASGGVEYNIQNHWLAPSCSPQVETPQGISLSVPKVPWQIIGWQHLHVTFTFAFQKRMR